MENHLNRKIENYFLSAYEGSSYIIRRKAYVLMWLLIIMIPVMGGLIVVNIYRNNPTELIAMLIIDILFILVCIIAFALLKKGKFDISANLIIFTITTLSLFGFVAKHPTVIQTGFNSFVIYMLASIVFTAIFGSRKVLLLISFLFTAANIGEYFLLKNIIAPELFGYLISGTLNTLIGLIIIVGFSYFNRLITDGALILTQKKMEDTVEHAKELAGLIPICSHCKNIRDDSGYWNQIESYIKKHSTAQFSHGICPDCMKKLYGNEDWFDELIVDDSKKE